ncbi:MAG: 6-phosphogluconolactonase [Sphaerochaetaceae bacterium]|nr:6-phosphogluconolactonase [Sphaerochaetaceae bacterium]
MDNAFTYSMKMTISPTRKEMGQSAGQCGEELLVSLLAQKETVRVIMGSAPSQDDVLGYLRESKKIDWARVEVFHMDEYIGISPDDKAAFSNYLDRTLFHSVKVKAFHKIVANNQFPQSVCDEYSKLLLAAPIDIVFLGIGENGHIAFNDPEMADLKDPLPMKIVTLDNVCRMQQVHDGCFNSFEEVPNKALSLSVPMLMSGSHLVCTVPTAKKNKACLRMIMGSISAECPATAMRLHPDCNLFMDNESGHGIPDFETVETVLSKK